MDKEISQFKRRNFTEGESIGQDKNAAVKKPYRNFKKPYKPYHKQELNADSKESTENKEDKIDKDNRYNKERRYNKDNRYTKNSKENINRSNQQQEDTADVDTNETLLFGRNSVIEVLKSDRDIDKILVQKGELEGSIRKIIGEARQKSIVVQEVEKNKLDELTNMERHQGVVAYVSAKQYSSIEEILNDAKAKAEDPFILILENIQDPHNLGAIIRSAHTAGVHGIIIPKRRAVGLTATVSKASAGALEHMKIAKVNNIAQTIEELKTKGIWVACADMDGEIIYKDNMRGPIGIVIGSEGEGITKHVKAKCDFTVSIPMYGKVSSLNASVAAGIMVYEVVRQRHF